MSSSKNDDFRKLRNMELFDFNFFSPSEAFFISESQTILMPVNNQRRTVGGLVAHKMGVLLQLVAMYLNGF